MSEAQTIRRVSMTQLLHLWEFLNNHREIAVGYNKSTQARAHSKRMWERVAQILNSAGEGAFRSASEWSKNHVLNPEFQNAFMSLPAYCGYYRMVAACKERYPVKFFK